MLIYEPEKRATAQEMLSSPWLNMEPNFDYKMSEREYEKMNIIKKNNRIERKGVEEKDVIESDVEIHHGDKEDNDNVSDYSDDDSYMEPTENINIQNFNNSFAVYGQHVKLSALDKANPQFK